MNQIWPASYKEMAGSFILTAIILDAQVAAGRRDDLNWRLRCVVVVGTTVI